MKLDGATGADAHRIHSGIAFRIGRGPLRLAMVWLAALLWLTSWAWLRAGDPLVVRYPPPTSVGDVRYGYILDLLRLALDRSGGNYRLEPASTPMNHDRIVQELRDGRSISVGWLQATKAREKTLRPIRFPLYQGFLGWRLLLIRGADQTRFDQVASLADLRQFRAGLEQDWPDVEILGAAGLPVVTTSVYDSLFPMLAAGRFDYLSRSILEIALEHERHQGSGLVIEQNLLLYYPGDLYFFVAPDDRALASRLELGLRRAVADGSFKALFDRHWGAIIQQAGVKRRRVLALRNPLRPAARPILPMLKPEGVK